MLARRVLAGPATSMLLVGALLVAVRAHSASAPARLAFDSGDHVYLMDADGTGRTRLTHDGPRAVSGQPAWSPDGSRIAFVRQVPAGGDNVRVGIWVMNADGTNPHAVTPTPATNVAESGPAWSPDGQRLAFSRERLGAKTISAQIVVADIGSGQEQVLVGETRSDLFSIGGPAWAPDGGRILFTRTTLDRRAYFRPSLQLVKPDGTGRQTLAADAQGGTWSPDGSRIAFTSVRDHNGDNCGSDECSYDGEIYVMKADGSQPRRLTVSKADDEGPAWSPDGQRIAFQSDRNFPDGQSPEVYSMTADGTCLTWLTNGAPGSGSPAWRPGGGSSDPGACGPTPRRPLVETDTSAATSFRKYPLYWLGPVSASGLLVSDVSRQGSSVSLLYDDCARYYAARCPSQVQMDEQQTCHSHPFLDLGPHPRIFRRRGALIYRPTNREESDEVYVGGVKIDILSDLRMFSGRTRDLADAVAHLRPVNGSVRPDGSLPQPGLPARLWRSLRRAEAVVRHLGSITAAAHALRISPHAVRSRIALLRALRSVGHVGTLRCHSAKHSHR